MGKTASFPVIGLGLDASGITAGLKAAHATLKAGMAPLRAAVTAPLNAAGGAFMGVGLANQAAEFSQKLARLFSEPFRQLMAQEDLFNKFSVFSSGTKEAGAALDRFKSIGRETGLSLQEMSGALNTLLQGQFSFAGAVVQIQDLSKIASVLGEGSLPMLTAAAAKFRSAAFAGFEDINAIALQGLPIFEALAQQLGVTADQARQMAKDGMVSGLQARNALNAAGQNAAGKNGGAQEQTLSGVISRLQEGLNQTLASIGNAISRVIDLPTLLTKFRGFVDGVRVLLEVAFAPFKGALAGGGDALAKAFREAQEYAIDALGGVAKSFLFFLDGLQKVANGLVEVLNGTKSVLALFLGEKFSPEQEDMIKQRQKDSTWGVLGVDLFQETREKAIQHLRANGDLPKNNNIGPLNFDVNGATAELNKMLAKAKASIKGDPAADAKAAADKALAEAAARAAENFNQAKNALTGFSDQFKSAFSTPFDVAKDQITKLNNALNDAVAQGVGDPQALAEQADQGMAVIGKGLLDVMEQSRTAIRDSQFSTVHGSGSAGFVESVLRAQKGGDAGASMETRLMQVMEMQKQIQTEQLNEARQATAALRAIQAKPAGNNVGKI